MSDGLELPGQSRPREIARLRHLSPLDRALVLILVPLWVTAFSLAVRTQAAAVGFEKRPGVPIRGRRETQDVYLLPLTAPS
jgi:hypothetical protein